MFYLPEEEADRLCREAGVVPPSPPAYDVAQTKGKRKAGDESVGVDLLDSEDETALIELTKATEEAWNTPRHPRPSILYNNLPTPNTSTTRQPNTKRIKTFHEQALPSTPTPIRSRDPLLPAQHQVRASPRPEDDDAAITFEILQDLKPSIQRIDPGVLEKIRFRLNQFEAKQNGIKKSLAWARDAVKMRDRQINGLKLDNGRLLEENLRLRDQYLGLREEVDRLRKDREVLEALKRSYPSIVRELGG
ncbi:uncharacterized protein CTHT_0056110 [Thermochaetoides thermophila DSM 1495]|uniref:Uncharacterized protein n=1 Tax=Chaetomium thermophilum (strain DSM 1495 / CBS 144.50 / IMI 039719) TaxID=759272 RepID=G0SC66_CHATD|nr:hypothetical protein CTHT_0056110 [Thermochaetoides thermophila DSM 1495]EGS18992.1 hypothetical protein CTHT_0056110 [Thermochaetoides thermophila DSM 1495]